MTTPIRYGRSLTIAIDNGVVTTTEETYNNYTPVKNIQVHTEIIQNVDERDILAIFLKLMDDQKAGIKDMIGLQCLRDPKTHRLRVEKSWIVPSLASKR